MTIGWPRIWLPGHLSSITSKSEPAWHFIPPPVHPDYHALPGAAVGGRALGAAPFDGRKWAQDFATGEAAQP